VMPSDDGFTACAQIKQREGNRNTPVLMITALEDNTSVERAFAVGASDYIPKPIHFAVLSQRVRSIIDATRAERHIRRLAYNDSLTGLPNRAMFLDRLGQQLEHAAHGEETVAVLFLDLDRFKYVNDTLGHDVGDRLLKAVADRIRRVVRGTDTVSRLGGDEFTVALAPADSSAAAAVAENICRTLTSSFDIDGHEIFMSTSIGISLYPQDGLDVNTLLKHADVAMYRAKKDNSGFQFFEASMEHSMSGQLRMETELRRALERHEFEVFYQPKAWVASGEVVGMEALVRWRHPARGLVTPIEFIAVAEQTGLIIALGEWVLRTACAQAQAWFRRSGDPLHVAVNISGKQLLQKDFVATVERALRDTGLAPQMLELEITESTLMEYAKDTLELLRTLRGLGVRLSIDDFGTGYSSLAYLKRFPVNTIKIDRAFVRDIPGDADDMAIASVMISLAHSLRLEVVAEGVETEAQRQFMREHGCELMQGYLLSEPVSAQVFESRMPEWAALAADAG
jgi:diguanylate cyclase (GGDEF)-like protein